ncbi:hypothetical protein [Nocardioides panacisoli]|uniref:DUF1795 domain-containing protein n=1 Tax=Nocardioides panacisoli TaxID=627624 RepID=A0ABP7IF33_9ACTN
MRSRVCIAAVVVVGLVALAGCSDDDPGDTAGSGGSPSGSSPASSSSESSAPPSSTATTATGQEVTTDLVSYSLPADRRWHLQREGQSAAYWPPTGDHWTVFYSDFVGSTPITAQQLAQQDLQSARNDYPDAKPAADRTVDGVDGWVIEASKDTFGDPVLHYRFGAVVHDTDWVTIQFTFPEDTPQTRAVIDSVLGSVRWR